MPDKFSVPMSWVDWDEAFLQELTSKKFETHPHRFRAEHTDHFRIWKVLQKHKKRLDELRAIPVRKEVRVNGKIKLVQTSNHDELVEARKRVAWLERMSEGLAPVIIDLPVDNSKIRYSVQYDRKRKTRATSPYH